MRSIGIAGICASTLMLFACSNGDTIVSLNVNSSSDVELVTRLHVKFTQDATTHEVDLEELPTREVQIEGAAGGVTKPLIVSSFYRRITLPTAFKDGDAKLDVDAYNGTELYVDPPPMTIEIQEKETVAAFVDLKRTPAAGGAGGAGGTNGTNAGGAGGTSAGGTSAAGAGGTSDTTATTASEAGASSTAAAGTTGT